LDTNGASSSTLNQICNTTTGGNCPFIFQIHPGFNGWNAAGQLNFNSWFGITADISGHYGTLPRPVFREFTSLTSPCPSKAIMTFSSVRSFLIESPDINRSRTC
jgi:hypothetical protein